MISCLQNTPPLLHSASLARSPMEASPFLGIPSTHFRIPSRSHAPMARAPFSFKVSDTHLPNSLRCHLFTLKAIPTSFFSSPQLPLSWLGVFFPAFAASSAEMGRQAPDKINLEAIVVAIDDFNNRNPFFVAGITFVWLVVIPLTQEYLKKFKLISAIDAFRRLRDDPSCQLLDVRKNQSLKYLSSPNLRILQKSTVQVIFSEVEEKEFVKEVLKFFPDPGNTVLCILDK